MPNAPVCDQGWTRAVVTSVPVCHQGRAGAGHGLCAVRAPLCLQPLACALTLCPGHCLTSPSSKALFCWLSKMKSGGSKQAAAGPSASRASPLSAPRCLSGTAQPQPAGGGGVAGLGEPCQPGLWERLRVN